MNQTTYVIVNPSAGGGKVRRRWSSYSEIIESHIEDVQFLPTTHTGHGRELARKVAQDGAFQVLSLGGDGTHNEVLNGLMEGTPEGQRPPRFGVLPAGTGGDFRKVLYRDTSLHACLDAIVSRIPQGVDVGRVTFEGHQGGTHHRYFLNIASVGIGGLIDEIVNRSSKRLGGRISFLKGTLQALIQYEAPEMRVEIDGENVFEGKVTNVLACNGRYAGGGMYFAPGAKLNSGRLCMVIIPESGLLRQMTLTPKLYDGSYLSAAEITFQDGKELRVTPVSDSQPPAYLDIDGEAPGVAPATFRVLDSAIEMLGIPDDALCPSTPQHQPPQQEGGIS